MGFFNRFFSWLLFNKDGSPRAVYLTLLFISLWYDGLDHLLAMGDGDPDARLSKVLAGYLAAIMESGIFIFSVMVLLIFDRARLKKEGYILPRGSLFWYLTGTALCVFSLVLSGYMFSKGYNPGAEMFKIQGLLGGLTAAIGLAMLACAKFLSYYNQKIGPVSLSPFGISSADKAKSEST
jgi:hypothetical protein